jgi:hypothetical protein
MPGDLQGNLTLVAKIEENETLGIRPQACQSNAEFHENQTTAF